MDKVIIIGNSDFAQLVYDYLRDSDNLEPVAFSVQKAYIKENTINGLPVIAFEDLSDRYDQSCVKLVTGVGYSKMNSVREKLHSLYMQDGWQFTNYIHPTAIIASDVLLGTGNIIFERVLVQKHCKIGKSNIMWPMVNIAHDNIIGDFNQFSQGTVIAGKTIIGDKNFFAVNSTVIDNSRIEDSVLIGAGSVARRHCKNYEAILPAENIVSNRKSIDFKL